MKKFLFAALALTMLFSFTNCSDDDDNGSGTEYTPPTQEDLQNLFNKSLKEIKIEKVFDVVDNGITYTSPKGVEFEFNGGFYNEAGEPVTGNVTLEYVEIFDRGNMVTTNKPLMAYDDANNLRPLITGGIFYVNFTQNGKQLSAYNSYSLVVPAELTGGVNEDMILWNGNIDDNGNLTWTEKAMNNETTGFFADTESNKYQVYMDDFEWTNIDILASEKGEKTPLRVRVPEGYDNKNASVYVAYKGEPGMLAFLDTYSPSEKLFSEHYGWAPIDFSMYVIFVSEHNGKYLYSIKDITVVKNAIITINSSDLKEATKVELSAKINALP